MAREVGLDAHTTIRAAFEARHRQGDGPRAGGDPPWTIDHRLPRSATARAPPSSTPWPRTTWTSTGRRSSPCWFRPPTQVSTAARNPAPWRDILESYVKRLREALEHIADSFEGVPPKAFALQAGREIRIMVESDSVSDDRGRVAVEGHRQARGERARLPRADQGHRTSERPGPSTTRADERALIPARRPLRACARIPGHRRHTRRARRRGADSRPGTAGPRRCHGRHRRRRSRGRAGPRRADRRHHGHPGRRGALRPFDRLRRRHRTQGARGQPERP